MLSASSPSLPSLHPHLRLHLYPLPDPAPLRSSSLPSPLSFFQLTAPSHPYSFNDEHQKGNPESIFLDSARFGVVFGCACTVEYADRSVTKCGAIEEYESSRSMG